MSAVHAAGVAPHLTIGVAKALYGADAPTVCKVFQDGLTTAERNDVLGNPSGRRPKTITSDALAYGRAVVQTYCPEELSQYENAVDEPRRCEVGALMTASLPVPQAPPRRADPCHE